ncbi:hypothetical protein ACFE04_003625 [Oxalis oulophora]
MRDGKLNEIVDERIIGIGKSIDEKELKTMVYVAFWCIQEKARVRPSMALVVDMLEGRVNVDEPPDTPMIIVDLLAIDDDDAPERFERRIAGMAGLGARGENVIPSLCPYAMSSVSPSNLQQLNKLDYMGKTNPWIFDVVKGKTHSNGVIMTLDGDLELMCNVSSSTFVMIHIITNTIVHAVDNALD